MTLFYEFWLEEEMPIREAFAAAQAEMWLDGDDPHQWAGFVLVE